ncbi:MAG: ABC transporter permease [candidate division KSB1 bacterium]|nr:ABC transporter permease [candidate division KSB1 bacterium]MDZ7336257.1 ABC transporter permease [candidate division KSB1 bacterium]MDZ7357279.1 ABC transporter permease [candidate division KSB1 bacterium]MDZ7401443.1 ABC transporter permease [candidate division KSB1 bacterium]
MNRIAQELNASFAFVIRNFHLLRRYIGWESVFLIYTIVNTITIGLIGWGDPEKILYLIIGSLLWGFLSVLFHDVAEAVAWERWEGTIEYTFMAPIYRFTYLIGQCTFAVVYAILRSAIILVLVGIFFNISFSRANLTASLIIIIISSFSFLGMGLIAAILPLLSPEKGAQAAHIFQAVILLVSGVYYDVSVLPSWLRPLSAISPGTYTLRAIRRALLENASIRDLAGDIAILLITGAMLIPAGLWIFNRAEIYAKKHGKLKRSG